MTDCRGVVIWSWLLLCRLSLDTDRVTMVTFGSPRVGDEGFRARLRLLYHEETKLMNVLYPLDTVSRQAGRQDASISSSSTGTDSHTPTQRERA